MGNKHIERAKELRSAMDPMYNCCQSVLIPFAEDLGNDIDTLYHATFNFSAGMKQGKTCGAVVGGLIALSLNGITDALSIKKYFQEFSKNHQGETDCAKLRETDLDKFNSPRDRCNALIYECIEIVEKIIKEAK